MEAAEEELAAAVDAAYAEGYKAAMLRYAPGLEAYKAMAADTAAKLETAQKKSRSFWPSVGIAAGASFAAGFLCSFFMAGR
jgi:hypothetical protein